MPTTFTTISTRIAIPLSRIFYENREADRVVIACANALANASGNHRHNIEMLVTASDRDSVILRIDVPEGFGLQWVADTCQAAALKLADSLSKKKVSIGRTPGAGIQNEE